MQDSNRFAPPKAVVEGTTLEGAGAPPLWNPNAAANWCLLFSPLFGAWLQMCNWRALGETKRADTAKVWLVFSGVFVLLTVIFDLLLPNSVLAMLTAPLAFVWLIVWYFASARPHARWVAARFGPDYPRQPWLKPLLWGFGGYAAYVALGLVVDIVTGARY